MSNRSRLFQLEVLEERALPSTTAANFADGVWRYDTSIGWTHLTTQLATQLRVDDAGNVAGTFANGLWRWTASAGWQQLSTLTAQDFQVSQTGVLYGDFGSSGTWRWSAAAGWQFLSPLDANRFAVADTNTTGSYAGFPYQVTGPDAIYAVYANGTWRWSPDVGWNLLTTNRPDLIDTDNLGSLVANFSVGTTGSWRWNSYNGWKRLSYWSIEALAVSRDGTVYEDRGNAGVHKLPIDGDFSQISSANATVFTALPNGDLFISIGSQSWLHSKAANTWALLAISGTPTEAAVGKDGDLFVDAGALYLRETLISGGNPTRLAGQG